MPRTFADALRGKYAAPADAPAEEAEVAVAHADQRQRESKTWEMVGMDSVKRKTGAVETLRTIGLSGEGVEAAGDPAEIAALGAAVVELDLSQSAFAEWEVPGGIAAALPVLTILDISANKMIRPAPTLPGAPFCRLRTLVLNRTGAGWADVAALSHDGGLALLQVLRMDANEVAALASAAPSAPDLPELKSLSLLGNALTDWGDVIAAARGLPVLTELGLSKNNLPAPSVEEALQLAALPLESLAVADNPMAGGSEWVRALGTSERLGALRITAASCYGSVAPQFARLLLIADMPRLATLNASDIRARERQEAERFFLTRAVSELRSKYGVQGHGDDCAGLPPDFVAAHPRYVELVAKHGNPSYTAEAPQGKAASSNVNVLLRGVGKTTMGKPDVTRALPGAVKVGQLKAVIRASFGIAPDKQRLVYKTSDEIPVPVPLDSDIESLAYFGVTDGGMIEIHEHDS